MSRADFSDRPSAASTAGVKGLRGLFAAPGSGTVFAQPEKTHRGIRARTFRCRRGGFCSASALRFCWRSAPPRLLSTSSHDPTWPGSTCAGGIQKLTDMRLLFRRADSAARAICLPVINPSCEDYRRSLDRIAPDVRGVERGNQGQSRAIAIARK